MTRMKLLHSASIFACMVLPSHAHASVRADAQSADVQSADVQSAEVQSGDASPKAPVANGDQVPDIVVTAQRRTESAQKASLSITALAGQQLADRGITEVMNLNNVVPGLKVAYAAAFPQFYVRGVGDSTANALSQSSTAINMNGIYVARPTVFGPLLFDVERLEVLRGPQGTLYGRNATGGAINVITRAPSLSENGGFVAAELGNYNLYRLQAAVNTIVSDKLAVRTAVHIVKRDGYLSDGANDDESRSARLRLLWRPNESVTFNLIADMANVDGNGFGRTYRPVLFGDAWTSSRDPRINATDFPLAKVHNQYSMDVTYRGVSAELGVDLGGPQLTVIPAYKYNKMISASGGDFLYDETDVSRQKSLEVRVGQSSAALKWVSGVYAFKEDLRVSYLTDQRDAKTLSGLRGNYNFPYFDTTAYAAFGEATISLTNTLRLIGGLRYTWERRERELTRNVEIYNKGTVISTTGGSFSGKIDVDALTYRVGAELDAAPGSMLYATVSKSFKSGGFDSTGPDDFQPEYLTAFTLGSKNRFANNSLQFNAEAFFWKYTGQQISFLGQDSAGATAFITRNAGSSEIYGVDADIIYRASPNDTFTVSAEYLHTKYRSFKFVTLGSIPGGTILADGCVSGGLAIGGFIEDCSGRPLPRAPKFSGSARYEHRFDLGNGGDVTVGGALKFSSLTYLNLNYTSPNFVQEAFQVYDADLTYHAPEAKWQLQLWIRNIGNRAVYEQASTQASIAPTTGATRGSVAAINPPRTFGARFQLNF